MLRPVLGLLIIVIGTISVLRLTSAFFSDTETSSGNSFTAGELDLKIDNTSSYNDASSSATTWPSDNLPGHLFFDFNDLKPGDRGEDTISLLVQNPAWACMKINITQNSDESCTEPEKLDDPGCSDTGDLAQQLNFVFWADDGDNIHQINEPIIKEGTASAIFINDTWTLADSVSSIWPTPGPIPANETRYIGKYWCFGTLSSSVNPPGFSCDGQALDNAAQSDKVLADVEFTAVQSRHNPNFRCIPLPSPTPTVTPSATPTGEPTPTPDPFVDDVTAVSGTYGHCCDVNNLASDLATAKAVVIGAPDSPPNFNFIQISQNSSVASKFVDNKAFNGAGPDIRIHIYDNLFPASALVEVSADCSTYSDAGIHDDTANIDIDLGSVAPPLTEARCVRITGQTAAGDDPYPTLGFDLDAIEALNNTNP